MAIAAGTVQTVNTVNPSLTIPITAQIAKTATDVATGAVSSTGITNTRVGTLSGTGAGVSATNTQQQNYTVAPPNDEISLLNQQALYKYAVWDVSLKDDYTPARVFVKNRFLYDPFALQEPQCILCAKDQNKPFNANTMVTRKSLKVNDKLKGGWVHWDISPSDDFVDLGHYGNHELFISKEDFKSGALTNFVLATLSYSSPAETFGGGAAPPSVVVQIVENPSGGPGGEAYPVDSGRWLARFVVPWCPEPAIGPCRGGEWSLALLTFRPSLTAIATPVAPNLEAT
jgi:hypothetical protein